MKNKFFLISIAAVVIAIGAFFALKKTVDVPASTSTANNEEQHAAGFRMVPFTNSELIKPHSPIKGNINAKVTVVEFLDPECEACGAMHPKVKKIMQDHGADIQFVVRYMPYHKNSKFVANILEGARAEDKYWEALELLFATQREWADHHNPNPDLIPEILKPLKLNMDKIMADAKAGKYDEIVMIDQADGEKVGVNGTPTFFVNGVKLESLSYEALNEMIIQNK